MRSTFLFLSFLKDGGSHPCQGHTVVRRYGGQIAKRLLIVSPRYLLLVTRYSIEPR
ncbi:MAG: hypothetical protein ACFBSE_16675 [Prochloraceae cyanobacterium]